MKESIFSSPVGDIILIAHGHHLVYCNWAREECNLKREMLLRKIKTESAESFAEAKENAVLENSKRELEEYFNGMRKEFSIPLRFICPSKFQKRIWEELSHIPYGTTRNYGEIAESLGNRKAARGVARACGANPLAIFIPCHRVTASGGKPGGYTGGLDIKRGLLKIEGIEIF